MGLAGVKNKKKWAKDPNNTAWSRNADTFGQKIMRSQGWAPGEYLGARDASHSEFYSAANASHIRAVMKDDNMGLGARRNQGDECTGLDALQDLLSRLNGKSDESLGEERRKREDTKINKYLNRKIGTMRFVFGGLLVGDKVQELADSLKEKDQGAAKVPTGQAQGQDDDAASSSSEDEEEEEESAASAKKEKKSKKRKSEDDDDQKKSKKSKKRKTNDADEDDSKSKRKDKKDKKRRKEREEEDESSPAGADADESAAARKKSKKEKKEKRRKSKGDDDDNDNDNETSDSQSRKKEKKDKKKRKSDQDDGGETTKPSLPISGAVPVPHRHLARSRFIAQKRAAVMDQAALNQIFMIKA